MRTSPTVPYPSEQIDSDATLGAVLQQIEGQTLGLAVCDGGTPVAIVLTPQAFAALRTLVFDLELKADLLEARLSVAKGHVFDQSEVEAMISERLARVAVG